MKPIYYVLHTDGRILAVADSYAECSRLVDLTGVWDKAPGTVAPYAIQNFIADASLATYPANAWACIDVDAYAQRPDARERFYFALKDAIRDILALHARVHKLRAELSEARGFVQGVDNVVKFPPQNGA